jgi:hypothetical protein
VTGPIQATIESHVRCHPNFARRSQHPRVERIVDDTCRAMDDARPCLNPYLARRRNMGAISAEQLDLMALYGDPDWFGFVIDRTGQRYSLWDPSPCRRSPESRQTRKKWLATWKCVVVMTRNVTSGVPFQPPFTYALGRWCWRRQMTRAGTTVYRAQTPGESGQLQRSQPFAA